VTWVLFWTKDSGVGVFAIKERGRAASRRLGLEAAGLCGLQALCLRPAARTAGSCPPRSSVSPCPVIRRAGLCSGAFLALENDRAL